MVIISYVSLELLRCKVPIPGNLIEELIPFSIIELFFVIVLLNIESFINVFLIGIFFRDVSIFISGSLSGKLNFLTVVKGKMKSKLAFLVNFIL